MDIFLVSPNDAAKALCVSLKTLEAMRLKGNGPQWVRVSARKIAYRPEDVRKWIEGRLYSSTSEYGRAA